MASNTRKRSLTGKQVLEAIDALSDSDDFEENDSDRDSNYYPSDNEPENPDNHSDSDSDAENSANGKQRRESLAKTAVTGRDVSCASSPRTTVLRPIQLHSTSPPSSSNPTDSNSEWIPVSDSFKPPVVDFTECDGIMLPPGVPVQTVCHSIFSTCSLLMTLCRPWSEKPTVTQSNISRTHH